ncbi:hypothetical protein PRIPAC_80199, partial [Pristionchus pacificus]
VGQVIGDFFFNNFVISMYLINNWLRKIRRYKNEKTSFNGLPRDLLLIIIEYTTPKVLFKLRCTSSKLKSCVDEFATLHSFTPVIEKIKIKGLEDVYDLMNPAEETPLGSINVSVLVYKRYMKLFKLRLVSIIPFELLKESSRNERYYDFNFSGLQESDIVIDHLRKNFGRYIETVIIAYCNDRDRLAVVAKILEGVKINRMRIQTKTLTQPALDFLSQIGDYDVDKLKLDLERNMSDDPIRTLFDLSSLVRSLYIRQNSIEGILITKPFFFGVYDEDWAPVILEMFKRKLDKLCIRNIYSSYLGYCSANSLAKQLPLLDKKVWFSSSVNKHAKIIISETVSCNFNSEAFKGHKIMYIWHTSRVGEPF